MAFTKRRAFAKRKRPFNKYDPYAIDVMREYIGNLYGIACAMAQTEIDQKIEEAEKLISEGEKVDTGELVREICEKIIPGVMTGQALDELGAPGHLVPMPVCPICIEMGRDLRPLVDRKEGSKLKKRCTSIRRHIAMELGIIIPGVKFRLNLQLRPNSYIIKVREIETATGEVMLNHLLAIGPEDRLKSLKGTRTVDPTYGMPGIWISLKHRGNAEFLGCMIFDPVSVIGTQLTEVARTRAAELLGSREVQALVDTISKTHPAVVNGLIPEQISLREVQRVLQNLLREKVSVRDLVTILETIADNVNMSKDPELLTECTRVALSKAICREYMNNEGVINVITMDPWLEVNIAQAIQRTEMGTFLALEPDTGEEILTTIGEEVGRMSERGLQPIILCAPQIRPALKRLTGRAFPNLVVMSWNEIADNVNINSVGLASIDIPSINVLAMDVKLERWLSSHVIEINRKLEIKLDDADEEILIEAIGRQFGKLDGTDGPKIILCSPKIYSVMTWSLWGRLLRETLKELFPGIYFSVKDEYIWYSSRYNIVGIVSLDDDQPSEDIEEGVD